MSSLGKSPRQTPNPEPPHPHPRQGATERLAWKSTVAGRRTPSGTGVKTSVPHCPSLPSALWEDNLDFPCPARRGCQKPPRAVRPSASD